VKLYLCRGMTVSETSVSISQEASNTLRYRILMNVLYCAQIIKDKARGRYNKFTGYETTEIQNLRCYCDE